MTTKNVLVHMKTCQQVDDQKEEMEITTEGVYRYSPLRQQITYWECSQEEGEIETVITVDMLSQSPRITLQRKGLFTNCLTVQQGIRHQSPYTMGPCSFMMGAYGNTVACSFTQDKGSLFLTYDLDINAMQASRNTLELTLRKEEAIC